MLQLATEKLIGDVSTFAVRLGLAVRGTTSKFGLESDIGEVEFLAGGVCLSEHRHALHADVGQAIVLSLFDLFEWMCVATEAVLYGCRPPRQKAA